MVRARRRGDALDDLLRARGLRVTPQRRLVADAVDPRHSTPEQICERVQQELPSMNLSTVYRTLELLEDLGSSRTPTSGHGAPTYHPAAHADHLHLVCRRCGAVQEADLRHAGALASGVTAEHGFVTDLGTSRSTASAATAPRRRRAGAAGRQLAGEVSGPAAR
jgi:Fur family ferric uptake transcriptional regulator